MVAAWWLSGHIGSIYERAGVGSFSEFSDLGYNTKDNYWMLYPIPVLHIGMFASYIIAGIIVLCNLDTFAYGTRTVGTLFKNKDGNWGKIVGETHGFPFSKNTNQLVFDRITSITVKQGAISRMLNTGTLNFTTVTFTNSDSQVKHWYVSGIKKPHERKEEMEGALAGHEGLTVRLFQEKEQKPAF